MPIGEIVGEFILKPILEAFAHLLFYIVGFWTGFVFLEMVSFGKLDLATPDKFAIKSKAPKNNKTGKKKRFWFDCSLWIYHGKRSRRELKPEATAFVGILLWILAIVGYFLV